MLRMRTIENNDNEIVGGSVRSENDEEEKEQIHLQCDCRDGAVADIANLF